MPKKKNIQIVLLILLLLAVSFLVFRSTESIKVVKPHSLKEVLGPVDGYKLLANSPLDEDIVSFLDLDDYTQTRYAKDSDIVNLYIGYYNSLDKVSAAHSPLVCFPGQGWEIDLPIIHRLEVGNDAIQYAEIVASLGEQQELVLYWYQANDKTVPTVYRNKINAVVNKLTGKGQEHAFVRITVPFAGQDGLNREQARERGKEFILAFYPVFMRYLNSEPRVM